MPRTCKNNEITPPCTLQGTHDRLVAKQGSYARLVRNQLSRGHNSPLKASKQQLALQDSLVPGPEEQGSAAGLDHSTPGQGQ